MAMKKHWDCAHMYLRHNIELTFQFKGPDSGIKIPVDKLIKRAIN